MYIVGFTVLREIIILMFDMILGLRMAFCHHFPFYPVLLSAVLQMSMHCGYCNDRFLYWLIDILMFCKIHYS